MYYNKTPEQRFEISFDVVEQNFAVPQLLDVEGKFSFSYGMIMIPNRVSAANYVITDPTSNSKSLNVHYPQFFLDCVIWKILRLI